MRLFSDMKELIGNSRERSGAKSYNTTKMNEHIMEERDHLPLICIRKIRYGSSGSIVTTRDGLKMVGKTIGWLVVNKGSEEVTIPRIREDGELEHVGIAVGKAGVLSRDALNRYFIENSTKEKGLKQSLIEINSLIKIRNARVSMGDKPRKGLFLSESSPAIQFSDPDLDTKLESVSGKGLSYWFYNIHQNKIDKLKEGLKYTVEVRSILTEKGARVGYLVMNTGNSDIIIQGSRFKAGRELWLTKEEIYALKIAGVKFTNATVYTKDSGTIVLRALDGVSIPEIEK